MKIKIIMLFKMIKSTSPGSPKTPVTDAEAIFMPMANAGNMRLNM